MLGLGGNKTTSIKQLDMPKPSIPLLPEGSPVNTVMPKQMDTEILKHMLDVNPMQVAFNCTFSGWRLVTHEEEREMFKLKTKYRSQGFVVDYAARMINESGSSIMLNEIMPLINPVSTTSHMKPIEIWDAWWGHILTVRQMLLYSYHLPSFLCTNEKCRYLTPKESQIRVHVRKYKHKSKNNGDYTEVINPYELDILRFPNIISYLCTMSIITKKSKEGFTLREYAESMITSNTITNFPMQPMGQQQGVLRRLLGR